MNAFMPIANAKDRPAVEGVSGMPNVRSAVRGWLRPVTLVRVERRLDNGLVDRTEHPTPTRAAIQPFAPEQLALLPEGERSWQWWMVHALPETLYQTADVILFGAQRLKIMGKTDYSAEGFVQYDAITAPAP